MDLRVLGPPSANVAQHGASQDHPRQRGATATRRDDPTRHPGIGGRDAYASSRTSRLVSPGSNAIARATTRSKPPGSTVETVPRRLRTNACVSAAPALDAEELPEQGAAASDSPQAGNGRGSRRDESAGGSAKLAAAQDRRERIEAALRETTRLQRRQPESDKREGAPPATGGASGSPEPRASTPDPETRVMRFADGGLRPGYNAQLPTTVGSGSSSGSTSATAAATSGSSSRCSSRASIGTVQRRTAPSSTAASRAWLTSTSPSRHGRVAVGHGLLVDALLRDAPR